MSDVMFLNASRRGEREFRAQVAPQGATLRELYVLYMEQQQPEPSTEKTCIRLRALIDGNVSETCIVEPLADYPTPGDVAAWLNRLAAVKRKDGSPRFSDNTLRLQRETLAAWYRCGVESGASHGNPAWGKHKVHKPARTYQLKHTPPKMVADDFFGALLDALADPRERAFFATMRLLALRPAEALGLIAWGPDSDLFRAHDGGRLIRVQRQRPYTRLKKGDPFGIIPHLKKGAPARVLPICDELWEMLAPLVAEGMPEVKIGHGGADKVKVPFLFPFRVNDVDRMHKAIQSTGLVQKGRGGYVMRHSWGGSYVQTNGESASVLAAQRAMGHKYPSTTLGYFERAGVLPTVSFAAMGASAAVAASIRGLTSGPPKGNGPTQATPVANAGPEKRSTEEQSNRGSEETNSSTNRELKP